MTSNSKLFGAIDIATTAHSGQRRKYTGEPYIRHPLEVAALVAALGGDIDMQCAAVLHDVWEDCGVVWDIRQFGGPVQRLVWNLTDQCHDGNRAFRKKVEADRIGRCGWRTQMVKACDVISNTPSIVRHDPKFAVVYLNEKRYLFNQMTKLPDDVQTLLYAVLLPGWRQFGIERTES